MDIQGAVFLWRKRGKRYQLAMSYILIFSSNRDRSIDIEIIDTDTITDLEKHSGEMYI